MINFNRENILPDPNNTKELFTNCQFFLEKCEDIIVDTSEHSMPPNYKESIDISKCLDDLNFVKLCARVYVISGKSKDWKAEPKIIINVINFLREFKSSDGSIEICRKIKII